jgi:ABC-2 type transport system ATP-binding protein
MFQPPVLHVLNGAKHFGDTTAFAQVSLTLAPGEITAVAGPNGGGKTSLLRTVVGLLEPDTSGSVLVQGRPPARDLAVRRQIGYVPDEDDLLQALTGAEYVRFVAAAYAVDPAAALDRAAAIARELDLSEADFYYQLIAGYSHGMRKKTQLAAVLATRPKLLVIDEPTNGLDPTATIRLKAILKRQTHSAVLVASHHLAFAEALAGHVLLLRQTPLVSGRLAQILAGHKTGGLEKIYEELVLQSA